MIKTIKQAKREVRQIFRLCFVNGVLDEGRVLQAVQTVLQSRHRGYLILLGYFLRLLKRNLLRPVLIRFLFTGRVTMTWIAPFEGSRGLLSEWGWSSILPLPPLFWKRFCLSWIWLSS